MNQQEFCESFYLVFYVYKYRSLRQLNLTEWTSKFWNDSFL